jgi:hypothetical protein
MFESDEIEPRGHATVASSNSQQVTKRAENDKKTGFSASPERGADERFEELE